MPYPWARGANRIQPSPCRTAGKLDGDAAGGEASPKLKRPRLCRSPAVDLSTMPWFSQLVLPCLALGCITFDVPKPGALAGQVLRHSLRVIEALFQKHDPCICKIGVTHSPHFRWTNRACGYQWARDGWEHMTVVYISNEQYGPAMLEASLINQYISLLAQL